MGDPIQPNEISKLQRWKRWFPRSQCFHLWNILGFMRGPITSPRCEYRIRNPIDDSLVERAAIGDIVRHEWSCKIGIEADLCLVVTSCYLLTSDSKHHLINEQGCSTDASVLPELHYVNKANINSILHRTTRNFVWNHNLRRIFFTEIRQQ